MQENSSVNEEQRQCIIALMPELDSRYRRLKALLEQAAEGRDIDEHALWLARGDVLSAVKAMTGSDLEDDE
jgi:hypothetical protein